MVASEVHVSGSSNNTDPLARVEVLKPIITEKSLHTQHPASSVEGREIH